MPLDGVELTENWGKEGIYCISSARTSSFGKSMQHNPKLEHGKLRQVNLVSVAFQDSSLLLAKLPPDPLFT